MSLKTKFFKMLGELDEEEKVQLKEFFGAEEPTEPPLEPPETPEAAVSADNNTAAAEEQAPPEEPAGDEAQDEQPAEANETPPEPPATEEIPPMTKGEEPVEEIEEEAEIRPDDADGGGEAAIADDEGEDLPVDFKSIVDGLNAKVLALEAENKQLKSKVEGAFGYSMKPPSAVKVNPLYSDDTSDIHFKK